MVSDNLPGLNNPDDVQNINFISILDNLDEGVIITDKQGIILYYNKTQSQIDELPAEEVIGKKVTDIYELSPDTSLIMLCIKSGRPVRNRTFFYKTSSGKVANTIHSIFPIFSNDEITGTICFVRDYKIIKKTTPIISVPDLKPKLENGTRYTFADIIGASHDMVRSVNIAREAADSASPIMLIGETGTGKELFAQAIHNHSSRKEKSYIAVNCAAIPETLLEGVLFGTSKGAFTGAIDKPGLLERANGSTLFLDELLAMPVNLQAKLLRVLQEKKVRRVGSFNEMDLNLKIVSSVSRSPRDAIKDNELRTDLFYRLGVVMVKIPPLRDRTDDIEEFVRHFILNLNSTLGTNVKAVSDQVMELFTSYSWPGNVRELEHIIEGALNIAGYDELIDIKHFTAAFETMDGLDFVLGIPVQRPDFIFNHGEVQSVSTMAKKESDAPRKSLSQAQADQEREAVFNALKATGGNVSKSAEKLGISRQLLNYKMKKHGLRKESFSGK